MEAAQQTAKAGTIISSTVKHNAQQEAAFESFKLQFKEAFTQQQDLGRLKKDMALNVKQLYLDYIHSLGYDQDDTKLMDAAMGAFIDNNCEP